MDERGVSMLARVWANLANTAPQILNISNLDYPIAAEFQFCHSSFLKLFYLDAHGSFKSRR
jgi:hypothetical protein